MDGQGDSVQKRESAKPLLVMLWRAVRGLAVGVCSALAAALVFYAIGRLFPADTRPCDDTDLACLPDLEPLIFAVLSVPVVVAVTGPFVARLMRSPRPWVFALPALWALILACGVLGPAVGQNRWPFNDALSSLLILWIPYGLVGLWAFRPPTPPRSGGQGSTMGTSRLE